MKTLAILSRKGGVGKTLISLHLSVASQASGIETALIDLDPQASATGWAEDRENDEPFVLPVHGARLSKTLTELREQGAQLAIVDTAPNSEGSSLIAARAADLVLIPCQPAILDLKAIRNTVDIANLAKVKAYAVLNRVPPKGSIIEDSKEAIAQYDLEVCPKMIGQRVAYSYSLISGMTAQEYEPNGQAAKEFSQFYKWVVDKLS